MTVPSPRRIIHVDMDAFYASVEQRDDPSLRGRPVAVGGSRERGVVAAASYEARAFGVRSAMPSVTARRRCPDLVFVRPRFDAYKAVSAQIHAVFSRYTHLIQPLSLDEAYLDVTEPLQDLGSATAIAAAIKAAIRDETGLTASAGVSYNKFLAKLASDHCKPDGLFVVTPAMGYRFVEDLPVGKFHGVGPVTAARMERLGIHTGLDLRQRSREELAAISEKVPATCMGSRAASMNARSKLTGSGSRSGPRTRSSATCRIGRRRRRRHCRYWLRFGMRVAAANISVAR